MRSACPNASQPRFSLIRTTFIAFCWQIIPVGWLMIDIWDTPDVVTYALAGVSLVAVPIVTGLVHKSTRIGLASLLVPLVLVALMFLGFLLLMLFASMQGQIH